MFDSYINQESLFKNKVVFANYYKPDDIMHRGEEINQLGSILAPSLKGNIPSNILIFGTVGTGKTLVVRHVLDKLSKAAAKAKSPINMIYINCKMKKVSDTEYRLVSQILRKMGLDVPDTGLPTNVLYQRLFEKLEETKVTLLILDEIDALVEKVGDGILYNLTRINSDLKKGKVGMIGITNDLSFTDLLDPRVKSSLSEEELIFSPYNALHLKNILKERVKEGMEKGALSDAVITKCAALAAQEHGDARRALDLLRVAGEIAERKNEKKILERHVDMAETKLDLDRVTETVKTQPKQSQAVLLSIIEISKKDKEITTGDIFEVYKNTCEKNGLKVLTQRRVSDLISELDMLGIITTTVVSRGRYGRSREIKLAIGETALNKLKDILYKNFE